MHIVLVIGGYMIPSQADEAAAEVEYGGDDDGAELEFSFQFGVLPYTNRVAW